MKIAIIGLAEAGLVTAACLADMGHQVMACDAHADVVSAAAAGGHERAEPGLASLIEANCRRGRLAFTRRTEKAVQDAEAVFLAMGPDRQDDGREDCHRLMAAVEALAPHLAADAMVVLHAAVPIGTADRLEALLPGHAVVSNPHFQRAGSAVLDVMQADRIVIGSGDSRARQRMGRIYRPLCLDDVPIVYTSRRTAEMLTYAANAYLAMKRSLAQEMSALCVVAGADLGDLARGIDLDRRVGPTVLAVDPANAGAAFPTELLALVRAVGDIAADDGARPARHERLASSG